MSTAGDVTRTVQRLARSKLLRYSIVVVVIGWVYCTYPLYRAAQIKEKRLSGETVNQHRRTWICQERETSFCNIKVGAQESGRKGQLYSRVQPSVWISRVSGSLLRKRSGGVIDSAGYRNLCGGVRPIG